jgi:hypothetical protein|eukprot:scaffold1822_cov221-Alexandrium_tamarense.AAC.9
MAGISKDCDCSTTSSLHGRTSRKELGSSRASGEVGASRSEASTSRPSSTGGETTGWVCGGNGESTGRVCGGDNVVEVGIVGW